MLLHASTSHTRLFFVFFFFQPDAGKQVLKSLVGSEELIKNQKTILIFWAKPLMVVMPYAAPVRQTETLLWASFRLRLTTDALALC